MPRRSDVPGPGHYNPAPVSSSRACSLHGRHGRTAMQMTPGPGEYVPTEHDEKAQWRFGTSQRPDLSTSKGQPGPSEYTPRDPNCQTCPKVRFGTGIRGGPGGFLPNVNQSMPGPGSYTPRAMCSEQRSTSFAKGSGRPMARVTGPKFGMESPGPAAYFGPNAAKRAPVCAFGSAARVTDLSHGTQASRTPGPGQYESRYESKAPKITITPRREYYD